MKTKEIKSEYSFAEWMTIRKAAEATRRSLRQFQADAALTMARELLKDSGEAPGRTTKDDKED